MQLELTLAGSQVTDYAWYSTNYTAPMAQQNRALPNLAVFACTVANARQRWTLVPVARWTKEVLLRSVGDVEHCITITDQQYDGGNGTGLAPCDALDPRQQWLTDGTHIKVNPKP